jgi:hypothetical protein
MTPRMKLTAPIEEPLPSPGGESASRPFRVISK